MGLMNEVDGNAIAGTLFDVFGVEMTDARGTCASCRTASPLGELKVYLGGPGTVARCRHCDSVLMVLVEIRGVTCVDALGVAAMEHPNVAADQPRRG
jgi:hypothetical protein